MSALFIETSAILSWFFEESKSAGIMSLIDQHDQIIASLLSILEAKRAFGRLEKLDFSRPSPRLRLLQNLEKNSNHWEIMEITPQIQQRISEPFPIEPVRTLDAIHLASALEASKIFPELHVLTLDQRLITNLEPLGLTLAEIK